MSSPSPRLRIRFQLQRDRFHLKLDWTAPAAGVIALAGPSGAGKSTLLRCLAGLDRAPGGLARLGAQVWQDDARNRFVPPHRRDIALVFQDACLFPHLSVQANLQYGWRRTPVTQRRLGFDEVVNWLDLSSLLARRPDALSGGERQRVALGRALLTSPRLLLLDEPLAALDPRSKQDILPYLERLRSLLPGPVIYVSHSLEELTRLADHLVWLENGRIKAEGPLPALLARLDLSFAREEEAGAILQATVAEHDPHYALTRLDLGHGTLWVNLQQHKAGERIRIKIHARDVSLSRQPPHGTSILNALEGRITDTAPAARAGQLLVKLAVGEQALLARLTRKSWDELALQPGAKVHALIKSVALMP
ncbi:MAG TPA: molybdenum ABC transporter ATP-binding protein [Gammaproteobacteria bacterium]|nr:molybdenum ABC transporter ATP-binding protein [Gammaproteobacteria bacterium]